MAIWAIVPAAGSGRRMQTAEPKQYLHIDGVPLLLHTLRRLAALDELDGIVLVLSTGDRYRSLMADRGSEFRIPLLICDGGDERFQSVGNGLQALADRLTDGDWVLVHDAARPCVRVADMSRLIHSVAQHRSGGILAVPVSDTLKRATPDNTIQQTVNRSDLWLAQTPQMFRYGLLRKALHRVRERGVAVTDEASAMERDGHSPLLVMGSPDNIKVTWPRDLQLASLVLRAQQLESTATPD